MAQPWYLTVISLSVAPGFRVMGRSTVSSLYTTRVVPKYGSSSSMPRSENFGSPSCAFSSEEESEILL